MRLFNVTFIGGVIVAVVAISWQDSKSGDYIGYAADFSGSYLSDLSVLSEIINEDDSEDVWRDTLVVAEGHTLNRKYDFKRYCPKKCV